MRHRLMLAALSVGPAALVWLASIPIIWTIPAEHADRVAAYVQVTSIVLPIVGGVGAFFLHRRAD